MWKPYARENNGQFEEFISLLRQDNLWPIINMKDAAKEFYLQTYTISFFHCSILSSCWFSEFLRSSSSPLQCINFQWKD